MKRRRFRWSGAAAGEGKLFMLGGCTFGPVPLVRLARLSGLSAVALAIPAALLESARDHPSSRPSVQSFAGAVLVALDQVRDCPGATLLKPRHEIIFSTVPTATTLLVHLEYRETRGQQRCSAMCPGGTEARQDANSRSTEIFPRLGNASPRAAKRTRPFSRGYDLLRLFGAPLATNRDGPTDYSFNPPAYLRCTRHHS
jgi:hypothetical protein